MRRFRVAYWFCPLCLVEEDGVGGRRGGKVMLSNPNRGPLKRPSRQSRPNGGRRFTATHLLISLLTVVGLLLAACAPSAPASLTAAPKPTEAAKPAGSPAAAAPVAAVASPAASPVAAYLNC